MVVKSRCSAANISVFLLRSIKFRGIGILNKTENTHRQKRWKQLRSAGLKARPAHARPSARARKHERENHGDSQANNSRPHGGKGRVNKGGRVGG